MTALMKQFVCAIRRYCVCDCRRELCLGCVFEKWSQRNREIAFFMERRTRISAARRLFTETASR